jgi:hypothetical protein
LRGQDQAPSTFRRLNWKENKHYTFLKISIPSGPATYKPKSQALEFTTSRHKTRLLWYDGYSFTKYGANIPKTKEYWRCSKRVCLFVSFNVNLHTIYMYMYYIHSLIWFQGRQERIKCKCKVITTDDEAGNTKLVCVKKEHNHQRPLLSKPK